MFHGSIVAIVTPFKAGKVDLAALRELVAWHLASGTHGIVPVGTTGESPTLSHAEKRDVIRTVVKAARGKVPVIAGTGTNDTRTTIELTKMAQELGADAALVVTPYYNKPTQEGLYRHYEAVSRSTKLPLVLYNVPGRTAVNLLPETAVRLAGLRNIVAIKEASGSLEQSAQIHASCGMAVISGDDALTLPLMAQGATGVISVAANVVPKELAALCTAMARGELPKARQMHLELVGLMKSLFIETSPVPVKTALKLMGRGNGEVRLPLCEMAPANVDKLKAAMTGVGLL